MSNHPTDGELILALDGELAETEAAAINTHLAECQECSARAAKFEAVSKAIAALHHRVQPRRRGRLWWVAAAAAAAAVALVWLAMPRQPLPAPPGPAAQVVIGPQSPPPAVKKSGPVVARTSPRIVRPAEKVSPFVALPFSDDALPLDNAPIVRVELPVESLRLAANLSVEGNVVGGKVTADVLLGLDGQPRAIRFVR